MRANRISDVRKKSLVLLAVLLFVYWPAILGEIFPRALDQTFPSPLNLFPGVIAWLLLAKIRCPYSRLLGYVWLLWYFVGTLNTIASSLVLGSYYSNLDLHEATQIFFWGCVFYFMGLFAYEKLFANNKNAVYSSNTPQSNIHPLLGLLLLAFPFAWLASMYVTLSYIPILRGVSIVDEMYQVDYGLLYPYGACIVISILYSGYRSMAASSIGGRIAFTLLAILFILVSMADGKRAFAMAAIGGLIGVSFRLLHEKTWTKILPIVSFTMIAMYAGVQLLRVGDTGAMTSGVYEKMMLVGVEFRDFVYTVNFFEPGEIENYSWGVSSSASMTNNLILQVFGLDKSELTGLDSAHAWGALWNTDFGIRTGIVSELWFAYGGIAMPFLFVFGLITGFIIKVLRTLTGERELLFIAGIFGLLFLAIINQSTFTFGILPVFLYLYVAMRIGGYLLRRRRTPAIQHA